MNALISDDNQLIRDIDLLQKEEKQQLLTEFNNVEVAYPASDNIISLFDQQAHENPDYTAVVFGETSLSYRELDEKSSQLANHLRSKFRLKEDDLVGLLVERSEWAVIGILGILKTGAAYVPLDPDYPADRVSFMIDDANVKAVVTESEEVTERFNLAEFEHISVIEKEASAIDAQSTERPNIKIQPEDLAYIIYTSGSTGVPKGVMVEHKNVVRLFFNDAFQFNFTSNDTWTLFHSICFDFSVWEIFGALLRGGRLLSLIHI